MINKILFVMRGINSIMKNEIFRIYVEKKKELDVEGDEILKDIIRRDYKINFRN